MSEPSQFLTTTQVARELAVSRSLVHAWIQQGVLEGRKFGSKKNSPVRVSRAVLDAFIDKSKPATQAALG